MKDCAIALNKMNELDTNTQVKIRTKKEINNHCKTEPIDLRELMHDKEKTIPVKIRSTEGISLGAL